MSSPGGVLVAEATALLPLAREIGSWNRQVRYGGQFHYTTCRLDDGDIAAMLRQEHWIGCRAAESGRVDRLAFDLDCKSPGDVQRRNSTYHRLRSLVGWNRVPLVYGTPSGLGLRVVYRIPEIRGSELVEGAASGLVPEVLRAANLSPKPGFVEIFPRTNQADRLMFGRRMPVLDPETLQPFDDARIGDGFNELMLSGAIARTRSWYDQPIADLVEHLRSLPRLGLVPLVLERPDGESRLSAGVPRQISRGVLDLIDRGLPGPSTRTEAEWVVGTAFVLAPERFGDYGLGQAAPSREAIARALATWLSRRNNGHSRDWNAAARGRATAAAVEMWTKRYLRATVSTGDCFVDRLYRFRDSLAPELRRVWHLTRAESDFVLGLAPEAFSGPQRYRFECWTSSFVQNLKRILHYHSALRTPLPVVIEDGRQMVDVEFAAKWLQGLPGGKGESSRTGQTRYREYLDTLGRAGVVKEVRRAVTPFETAKRCQAPYVKAEVRGRARTYRVALPDMTATVGDLPASPWLLKALLSDVPGQFGRSITLEETYHALHVAHSGIDLRSRYGGRTAERISKLVAEVDEKLAVRARLGDAAP